MLPTRRRAVAEKVRTNGGGSVRLALRFALSTAVVKIVTNHISSTAVVKVVTNHIYSKGRGKQKPDLWSSVARGLHLAQQW